MCAECQLTSVSGPNSGSLLTQFGEFSASLRAWHMAQAEFALHYWADPCVHGFEFAPRAGVSPSVFLSDTRQWELQIPALAGFSYAPLQGGGCDGNGDETHVSITLAVGVEAIHRGPTSNFALRLIPFGGWGHDKGAPDLYGDGWTHNVAVFGVTFEIGMVFPVSGPSSQ
jgi:hypothetical protein